MEFQKSFTPLLLDDTLLLFAVAVAAAAGSSAAATATADATLTNATLPPGRYYIGDIGHFLPKALFDIYNCGNRAYKNAADQGFIAFQTAIDYGIFEGSDRNIYEVDHGVLGVVSDALGDTTNYNGQGRHVTFVEPVSVVEDCGRISVLSGSTKITIDTNAPLNPDYFDYDEGYDSCS
jgi:hypothetical protein